MGDFRFKQFALSHERSTLKIGTDALLLATLTDVGNDLKPSTTARLKSKHRDGQLPFPELLDGVCQLLHPEGRFVVILPYVEGEAFHRMACERLHGVRRVFIRPTPTKPFHRVVLEYALRPVAPLVEHELTIRDAQNRYTPAYAHLVHPFLQNSNP